MDSRLENFSAYMLKKNGDIKEKAIHKWHLADDITASGIIAASGIFDVLKIDGPTTAGYILTTDSAGWGTWQLADHPNLANLEWCVAGHIIDDDIIPDSDGSYDIGSASYKFNEGRFTTLYGDGSNLTGIVTDFLGLSDTPVSYATWAASGVRVNAAENGLEFYATAAHSSVAFTQLTDVPISYAGFAASGVRVNASQSGLEFYPTSEGGGGSGTGTGVSYYALFDDGDLVAGVLTVTHNLGIFYNVVQVFDENDQQILPDSVTLDSTNQCLVDLSSYGSISGTWSVVVAGGGGTSDHSALSNLGWSTAGHTIDADLLPVASGVKDVGSKTVPFASGYFKEVNAKHAIVYDHEYYNGDSGSEKTISWINGNKQAIALTGAPCVLTFEAPPGACNTLLRCIQGTGGSKTVTWPSEVVWQANTAPTLSTTVDYVDVVCFYYDGAYYWGQAGIGWYK